MVLKRNKNINKNIHVIYIYSFNLYIPYIYISHRDYLSLYVYIKFPRDKEIGSFVNRPIINVFLK